MLLPDLLLGLMGIVAWAISSEERCAKTIELIWWLRGE